MIFVEQFEDLVHEILTPVLPQGTDLQTWEGEDLSSAETIAQYASRLPFVFYGVAREDPVKNQDTFGKMQKVQYTMFFYTGVRNIRRRPGELSEGRSIQRIINAAFQGVVINIEGNPVGCVARPRRLVYMDSNILMYESEFTIHGFTNNNTTPEE